MIWFLLAVAIIAVTSVATRHSRFRRATELLLSILVAIGLVAACVVWWTDEPGTPSDIVSPISVQRPAATIAPEQIRLEGLIFTQGTPSNSYIVSGTIHNDGSDFLDYFTLDVTLQDCPGDACTAIGSDEALILARIPPGREAPMRATLVFPERRDGPPVAPRWTTGLTSIRALPAGQ